MRGFRKEPMPVYLFTGFLDGGKTSFIRQTMDEGQFEDGITTLFIVCEEGEEEIDKARLDKSRFVVRKIEDEDDVNEKLLRDFENEVHPGRVIIESNGMWDIDEMLDSFPEHWELAEVITPVDSTTFEMYLTNMKMMMTNQFVYSDLVVFNRCTAQHDRAMFKRMVRAVNKRGQVLYETPEGEVEDNVPEELPYDINAEVIKVEDEDFGIFYIDTFDNFDNYLGKTVSFLAQAKHPKSLTKSDLFAVGRKAMTCCAEDISFVAFPCVYERQSEIKDDAWIRVEAKVNARMSTKTGKPAPVLEAVKIEPSEAAEDEIVYFY